MIFIKRKRGVFCFGILAVFLFMFSAFVPLSVSAEDTGNSGYVIDHYSVKADVTEDGVSHIDETITVNFTSAHHGIFRDIGIRNSMDFTYNGQSYQRDYTASVDHVNTYGTTCEVSREGDYVRLQLGDADRYVNGVQTYHISYDFSYGDDKIDALDFIYYNLIGNGWSVPITGADFTVQMPKEFDTQKVWFYTGAYGKASKTDVTWSVNNNTITGTLNRSLEPGEGVTVEVDLPQGYFNYPFRFDYQYLIVAMLGVLLVGSLILFFLFGRDKRPVQTVEFSAPEGIDPAQVGYIVDGEVDTKDIIALLIYWADKGYLSIEHRKDDEYTFHLLRGIDNSESPAQKQMFLKLFQGTVSHGQYEHALYDRTDVSTDELKYTFSDAITLAKGMVRDELKAPMPKAVFNRTADLLRMLVGFFALLPVFVTAYYGMYQQTYDSAAAMITGGIAAVITAIPIFILWNAMNKWQSSSKAKNTVKIIAAGFIFVALSAAVMLFTLTPEQYLTGVLAIVTTLILSVITVVMRKRTEYGNAMYGRILGLRNFIERAEKSRLEMLVNETPQLFYHILPYAYVLGVSDKWAKQFEDIAIAPPAWYADPMYGGVFSPFWFNYSMAHMLMYSQMQMSSVKPPPTAGRGAGGGFGGGSFGGGGFSGGGFGGGGGGAW